MAGLYVHIPFCDVICNYCDFPKRYANEEMKEQYIDALIKELSMYRVVFPSTIYIGGGTPSSLGTKLLRKLLSNLPYVGYEYTIEVNPVDVSVELLDLLAEFKITRISLGVQTTNDKILKTLNRDHTKDIIENAYQLVRKYSFLINVDLMYNLPDQTEEDIKKDVHFFKEADHISYYSLILEPKTVFQKWYDDGSLKLEDKFDDEFINELLTRYSFQRYEISNYTKKERSIHNLLYWNNKEYYGIGAGASGYIDDVRYNNTKLVEEYIKTVNEGRKPIADKNRISEEDQMYEFFMLGLRKVDGVFIDDFEMRYDCDPFDEFPIEKLEEDGFLEVSDDTIKPTNKGLTFNNELLVRMMEWR